MKKISFEKMKFESEDILSRLQMKKVKGGHSWFCGCTCSDGSASWYYTERGDPNTPVQPSAQAINNDLASECGVGGGTCDGCTHH